MAATVVPALAPADLDATWPSSIEPNSWVFADCNLPIDTLAHAVRRGRIEGTKLAVDAVSTPKVGRLPRDLTGVEVLFCNLDEAQALAIHHGWPLTGNALDLVELLHDHGAAHVVLSRGADGLVIGDADGIRMVPATAASVFDVTGAGDSMTAGYVHAFLEGSDVVEAVRTDDGTAVLLVEHDVGFVLGRCDRVVVLHLGQVLAEGLPDVLNLHALYEEVMRHRELGDPGCPIYEDPTSTGPGGNWFDRGCTTTEGWTYFGNATALHIIGILSLIHI